jgi:hypothetical protein
MGRVDVVELVASKAALPPALPAMLEVEAAPPESGRRLSAWFLAVLAVIQLGWLGAIGYALARLLG